MFNDDEFAYEERARKGAKDGALTINFESEQQFSSWLRDFGGNFLT